jgi:hypothetical protein
MTGIPMLGSLAAAGGHADRRVDPDRGGGRQALNTAVGAHDGAGTKKSDAGDNLRGHTARIGVFRRQAVRHQGKQRGTDGDQNVGAEPGTLLAHLPFEAEQCT